MRRVKGQPPLPDFGPKDIESAPTLKAAAELVARREQECENSGAELLAGSGVPFDRWKAILNALNTDTDPSLSSEEEKALLEQRFLRKKLVVGS